MREGFELLPRRAELTRASIQHAEVIASLPEPWILGDRLLQQIDGLRLPFPVRGGIHGAHHLTHGFLASNTSIRY